MLFQRSAANAIVKLNSSFVFKLDRAFKNSICACLWIGRVNGTVNWSRQGFNTNKNHWKRDDRLTKWIGKKMDSRFEDDSWGFIKNVKGSGRVCIIQLEFALENVSTLLRLYPHTHTFIEWYLHCTKYIYIYWNDGCHETKIVLWKAFQQGIYLWSW